jgi:acyl transferase domain-containing protein
MALMLTGGSLSLDTACSSSMYAVHLAVNAIRSGGCDSAIVAASNWIMDPGLQIVLDKLGAPSPTSTCHTFDASADGYARGEGFASLYLKKSSLAQSEESPIRAFIRVTAVNANGRTGGITRPSAAGQEAVIRDADRNAGDLSFADMNYFEVHGTGTPVGDPIEVCAVGNVFSSARSASPGDRLLIGSVITNLGHTEGASALAAIMKVVLSLMSGLIPPSVGVKSLNPNIDFDKAKVEVVRDITTWPKDKVRRASINSFGFGGANGHCIIDDVSEVLPHYVKPGIISARVLTDKEKAYNNSSNIQNGNTQNGDSLWDLSTSDSNIKIEARTIHLLNVVRKVPSAEATTRQLVLLPFSAHKEASLKSNIKTLSCHIKKYSLADAAYTLSAKRTKYSRRTLRIVDSTKAIQGLCDEQRIFTSPNQSSNIGFIFTGQEAQWHTMRAQLFEYHLFRAAIKYSDYVLGALPTPPS